MSWEQAVAALEQVEAERAAERSAQQAAQLAAGTHIRKKAGRSLATRGYSHAHRAQFAGDYVDPQGQTLCGAEATTQDASWSETAWAKNRAHVTCERCVRLREAAGTRS